MTCAEKLKMEHPEWDEAEYELRINGDCPSNYEIMDDPESCISYGCQKCWNREVTGSEDMSDKKYNPVQKAYDLMVDFVHENKTTDLEEVIGYLGEALDDHTEDTIEGKFANATPIYPCRDCDVGWGTAKGTDGAIETCEDTCEKLKKYHETTQTSAPTVTEPTILDSGDRTQFESGAVRDMREGKGRVDLVPLEVAAKLLSEYDDKVDTILWNLRMFQKTNSASYLYSAIHQFNIKCWNNTCTMLLEVAKHFEEGAKKYGESNWQFGIPTKCYIDSAARHYLKWLRGDKDEPHNRALIWNLMCCIWEVDHREKPKEVAE